MLRMTVKIAHNKKASFLFTRKIIIENHWTGRTLITGLKEVKSNVSLETPYLTPTSDTSHKKTLCIYP